MINTRCNSLGFLYVNNLTSSLLAFSKLTKGSSAFQCSPGLAGKMPSQFVHLMCAFSKYFGDQMHDIFDYWSIPVHLDWFSIPVLFQYHSWCSRCHVRLHILSSMFSYALIISSTILGILVMITMISLLSSVVHLYQILRCFLGLPKSV